MSQDITAKVKSKAIIDAVEPTEDTLSGRGGLSLVARFLRHGGWLEQIASGFTGLRKSRKGQPVGEVFKQLICFFFDGSRRHLVHFDHLKQDAGHAAVIESTPRQMLSSHAVKRFFMAFRQHHLPKFRVLLRSWFITQLRVEQPEVVVLGLDSVVLDNDEALKREGVRPTYRKVEGFEPLQLSWGRQVVDVLFRSGSRHSNHGDDALLMIQRAVKAIRAFYRADVPIIVRMDAGFMDQKIFGWCESEQVGYICGGKLYDDIKTVVAAVEAADWSRLERPGQIWQYIEWADRRGKWKRFRRVIYSRPLYENRQMLLDFARPDNLIYTNLGMGSRLDEGLDPQWLSAAGILAAYQERGSDELVHRAFKDFGFEQLPFQRFVANAAFYYVMMLSFVLFELFKQKVCSPVIDTCAYASSLRRRLIDQAAKIVRHAGRITLKVPRAVYEHLHFHLLWQNSAATG
jgi:Transposase DDE domain group 1